MVMTIMTIMMTIMTKMTKTTKTTKTTKVTKSMLTGMAAERRGLVRAAEYAYVYVFFSDGTFVRVDTIKVNTR